MERSPCRMEGGINIDNKEYMLTELVLENDILILITNEPSMYLVDHYITLKDIDIYNVYEKMHFWLKPYDECIMIVIKNNYFTYYCKGFEGLTLKHNELSGDGVFVRITKKQTRYIKISKNKEKIFERRYGPDEIPLAVNTKTSTFLMVYFNDEAGKSPGNMDDVPFWLKLRDFYYNITYFYNAECVNSSLDYFMLRFDECLDALHFAKKFKVFFAMKKLEPGYEQIVYNMGISYDRFVRVIDYFSHRRDDFMGIACNKASRMTRFEKDTIYICENLFEKARLDLLSLGWVAVSAGIKEMKGFDAQELYILEEIPHTLW